jgi:hypothetical protein
VDDQGRCYIYREFVTGKDFETAPLIYTEAVKGILKANDNEHFDYVVASPDLWAKNHDTGESGFEIMIRAGLHGLIPANNRRIPGWRTMREYLAPFQDEYGSVRARLTLFDCCTKTIECLPLLQYDKKNSEDASTEPHRVTHTNDSLRYGIMSRPQAGQEPKTDISDFWGRNYHERENGEITEEIPDNYINFGVE